MQLTKSGKNSRVRNKRAVGRASRPGLHRLGRPLGRAVVAALVLTAIGYGLATKIRRPAQKPSPVLTVSTNEPATVIVSPTAVSTPPQLPAVDDALSAPASRPENKSTARPTRKTHPATVARPAETALPSVITPPPTNFVSAGATTHAQAGETTATSASASTF